MLDKWFIILINKIYFIFLYNTMALQNGPEDHLPQMLQEFSQAHKQMQQLNSLFRKATPEAVQFFHDRRVTFVNNILTIGGHVLDLNRGENTEIYFAVN